MPSRNNNKEVTGTNREQKTSISKAVGWAVKRKEPNSKYDLKKQLEPTSCEKEDSLSPSINHSDDSLCRSSPGAHRDVSDMFFDLLHYGKTAPVARDMIMSIMRARDEPQKRTTEEQLIEEAHRRHHVRSLDKITEEDEPVEEISGNRVPSVVITYGDHCHEDYEENGRIVKGDPDRADVNFLNGLNAPSTGSAKREVQDKTFLTVPETPALGPATTDNQDIPSLAIAPSDCFVIGDDDDDNEGEGEEAKSEEPSQRKDTSPRLAYHEESRSSFDIVCM